MNPERGTYILPFPDHVEAYHSEQCITPAGPEGSGQSEDSGFQAHRPDVSPPSLMAHIPSRSPDLGMADLSGLRMQPSWSSTTLL